MSKPLSRIWPALTGVCLVFAMSGVLRAAELGELLITLENPTPDGEDRFGVSMAQVGRNLVVGAWHDSNNGVDYNGIVYVFDELTGTILRTLENPSPAFADLFGFDLERIDDRRVVVGNHADDVMGEQDVGTVYVFDVDTGDLLLTIPNPEPAAGDFFGFDISVNGDRIWVNCFLDDVPTTDSGTIYIFDADTGGLLQTVRNPTPEAGDGFGVALAEAAGNVIATSFFNDVGGGVRAGSALVLDGETAAVLMTVHNPFPNQDDFFGVDVDANDDIFVVGAWADDTIAPNAGTAYQFDLQTGALMHVFNRPGAVKNEQFSISVVIHGDFVIIDAHHDSTFVPEAGSAHVFSTRTGLAVLRLDNPRPMFQDFYAWSLGSFDDKLLVGAPIADATGVNSGALYVYQWISPNNDSRTWQHYR